MPHMESDDEVSFNCNLLKYLRLKEEAQLRLNRRAVTHTRHSNHIKTHTEQLVNRLKSERQVVDTSDEEDDEEADMRHTFSDHSMSQPVAKKETLEQGIQLDVGSKCTLEQAWELLSDRMGELKDGENVREYVIRYTKILRMHIIYQVPVDNMCLIALANCIRPSHVEDVFNLGLITEQSNVACLFKHGSKTAKQTHKQKENLGNSLLA